MDFIQGHEKVMAIFGRWPSFHDAYVRLLALEWGEHGMDVRMRLHTWESTGEVNERGYYRLHKHTLVELRFNDCAEMQIGGELAMLNIVFGLELVYDAQADRPVRAVLEGIGGLEGSFRCRRVTVVGTEPFRAPEG